MRFPALVVLVLVIGGCGGTQRVASGSAYAALSEVTIIGKSEEAALVFPTEEMMERYIDMQVERLGGASWQEAWLSLRRTGRYAVEPLIATLDDDRAAMAAATALPGTVTPGDRIFLTRREIAYSLLKEIAGSYSTYKGELPPLDKKAWEQWWRANARRIEIRTEAVIAGRG